MRSGGTWHLAATVAGGLAFAAVRVAPAYELRSAGFVGRCRAAFGTVQVAQFSYVHSGGPSENPPARGHTFVLIFDGSLRLRTYWEADAPLDGLHLAGTVLRRGEEDLFDFANPSGDTILVDGKGQGSPAVTGVRRPARLSRQHRTPFP